MHTTRTSRRLAGAALLAGPVVTLAGMIATPWEPERTTESYLATLAANPTQGQIACLLLVFGYALMGLASWTVLRHATSAPKGLRGVAFTLVFLGSAILPGMVLIDFHDLAMAQTLPLDTAVEVSDKSSSYGLAAIGMVPALAGFMLGTVLTAATAWRAKLVGWWVPAVVLGGVIAGMALPNLIGSAALWLIAYAAIAVAILRGPIRVGAWTRSSLAPTSG